nr:restriction endonuclease [Campylobacteraceae bacterium]
RKDNKRISNVKTQKLSDFQPLSKAANDVKRQICKKCLETNKRWNAKNILGNPYPFYEGDENYTHTLGCIGCYQYDPVKYRKESIKKIIIEASQTTTEFIFQKLYGEDS